MHDKTRTMTMKAPCCPAWRHSALSSSAVKELGEILADLRQDDRDWRRGQTALARALKAWRAEPAAASVLTEIRRFGRGAALDRCAALAELFDTASPRADRFVASLIAAGIAGLDVHPLGQIPIPHGSRDAVPTLILARAGRATLALTAYDGEALAALPAARTVRFQPVESWTRVLAGSGKAEHIVFDQSGTLRSERRVLGPGQVVLRNGTREALHIHDVDGLLVVLRLERLLDGVQSVREHSLRDGALLRQASARREDSRNELVQALLAQMQAAGDTA